MNSVAKADTTAGVPVNGAERARTTIAFDFLRRHHLVVMFAYLLFLEAITFGPIVPKVGFYLDDWTMVSQLYFGPQHFWNMLTTYFFGDPRIIVRPIEAPHFVSLFLMFGVKPLGYHVVNGLMEVITAWLGYAVVHRLTGTRALSMITAAVFLLYPIHDSTHYWVVASSATLSLMLYMASLFLHVEASERHKPVLMVAGWTCFALSIFNYECYLPLFPLNVAAAAFVTNNPQPASARTKRLLRAALESVPYVVSIAAVYVYGHWLVPKLGNAWVHGTELDLGNIAHTIIRGFEVSLGSEPFQLFAPRVLMDAQWKNPGACLSMLAAAAVGSVLLIAFQRGERLTGRLLAWVSASGILIVFLSYTIFGLNSEYQPTLLTFVNRINYAATLGAALIFGSLFCFIASKAPTKVQCASLLTLVAMFLSFCMLSNWALSRPWTMSWMMQKHIQKVLASNRTVFHHGDSIMLLNSPRYIMWSPVFDGTWDFQHMTRVTLDDATIRGGVATERLAFEQTGLVDVAHNYLCQKYSFNKMYALVATEAAVIPVRDPSDFVNVIRTRGMAFEFDKRLPDVWQRQIDLTSAHETAQ